ncbi:MAG: hypothetical protein QUV08_14760 [Parasphingorhabdus sp.]|nr:hypothetical protein [Parasphingorhabdus sp.]
MQAAIKSRPAKIATARPAGDRRRVDIKQAYQDIMERYPKTMARLAE